jgi:hypothetical protein
MLVFGLKYAKGQLDKHTVKIKHSLNLYARRKMGNVEKHFIIFLSYKQSLYLNFT